MYLQTNETRTNWRSQVKSSYNSQAEQCFDFQIAPEGAVLETSKHEYLIELRHIYQAESRPVTSRGVFDTPVPGDDMRSVFIEIMPEHHGLNNGESYRRLQVCPGGCSEGMYTKGEYDVNDGTAISSLSDEAITAILHDRILGVFRTMHPQRVTSIEIVATRVLWSTPIPAYFSLSESGITPHSSAVTLAHLALIQARGHIDRIEVYFRAHYGQHDKTNQDTHSYLQTRYGQRVTSQIKAIDAKRLTKKRKL
ncbi:hypothetical protein FHL15_004769 [Xylaria flabelliformis]|uniref:Uncharacterized protein n=1 Tax=Xylaria flabelliformis TaxID=2512241 RepID=A0A553I277_9PEZI|nr:hypothetical protein FHL15_004769 [Xylaria flabelliformis]